MALSTNYTSARLVLGVTMVGMFALAAPAHAVVTYHTHALSGQAAPGTGQVFSSFSTPILDDLGRVSFRGETAASDRGIWSEGAGTLALIALEGGAAPGTGGGLYNVFTSNPVMTGGGSVVFGNSMLVGPGGVTGLNNGGIWSDTSGTLSLIVREGNAAPGTVGAVFEGLGDTPLFNDAGQIAMLSALLEGTGDVTQDNKIGIWTGAPGSLSLIARDGAVAPGTAGAVFGAAPIEDPFDPGTFYPQPGIGAIGGLNDSGRIAVLARLYPGTGDATESNDEGIWSNGSGTLDLIARKGTVAPGTTGGVFNGFNNSPVINNSGRVAFHSYLLQGTGDVTADNDRGIWSNRLGSLALVVRNGDAAPDVAGATFKNLGSPMLNGLGRIAFVGKIDGPGITTQNDEGLWFEGPGAMSLIAREGDAAPGTTGVFNSLNLFADNFLLSDVGQIAFLAGLRSGIGGVTTANDRGIWATDANGQLTLVIREGDQIDVDNDPLVDDIRTVRTIDFVLTKTGGDDGRGTPFNDNGQLAFRLTFTNDSSTGIFTATLPVPVPGDVDDDGFVGIEDLNVILSNWNLAHTDGDSSRALVTNSISPADVDGDGFIGITDLNYVLSDWNASTISDGSTPATMPEPTSLLMLGLGGLVLVSRQRLSRITAF